tara:strand:+ start:1237 stop:1557 length:321 start_codon:yes stop_codon:yes gene_type:complete
MAVTIDTRPTVFGDRLIITGSYEAADTSIDLSDQLANIDSFTINPSAPNTAQIQHVDIVAGGTTWASVTVAALDFGTVSGTTITISPVFTGDTTIAGTFMAIGRRS